MTARFAGLQLVAFDLDGTLVDSAPDLCHCLGCAFASVGLSRPTEDETRSWIGDGVEALVGRGLEHKTAEAEARGSSRAGDDGRAGDASRVRDDSRGADSSLTDRSSLPFDSAYAEFLRCYAQNLFVRTRLYPGVAATLDELRNQGLRLCCITNKRLEFARDVLEQAGIDDRFELVLGGDSLAEKKPSPAQLHAAAATFGIDPAAQARACMLVGDSRNDYAAAQAAGWAFAWASYGYGAEMPAEPHARAAVARIDSMADLAALLRARGSP